MTATTLNGEDITINLDPDRVNDESNIIAADITADNGVIHVIDTVLAPTSLTSNIVDVAVATDDLSTLIAAVTAAGLGDALSGDGPFTVFGKNIMHTQVGNIGLCDHMILIIKYSILLQLQPTKLLPPYLREP